MHLRRLNLGWVVIGSGHPPQELAVLTFASSLPPHIRQAYLETDYHVFVDPPFKLKVGQSSEDLRRLHQTHGVISSAFLTAWNPEGQWASSDLNSSRQSALMATLDKRGRVMFPGLGRHPSGQHAGEGSLLALGVGEEEARELGGIYHQNAVIWAGEDATPRLIYLL